MPPSALLLQKSASFTIIKKRMKSTRSPLNPLNWVESAQNWFTKTERSSGFRPYLIFLLLHFGFSIVALVAFPERQALNSFIINTLYITIIGFIGLYAYKAITDPNFCRSEKHVENVQKIAATMETKGDPQPQIISVETTRITSNPEMQQLPDQSDK